MGNPMFDDPLLFIVNSVLLLGIVLAMIVLPKLKEGTKKLHEETMARRKLHHDEGY